MQTTDITNIMDIIPGNNGDYASVAGRVPPKDRVYQHTRPRSLFLKGPEEMDWDTVHDELKYSKITAEYEKYLEMLYQIRKGVWVATFWNDDEGRNIRDMIHNELKRNPKAKHFETITIELPRLPATHLILRGVPAETTKATVENTVNSYDFGKIVNMTRVYRRNTNIYNGYTNLWAEEFNKEKLPSYLIVDGYTCHIKTAEEAYAKKCYRCKSTNHLIGECPTPAEPYCKTCKAKGHDTAVCTEPNVQKEAPQPNRQDHNLRNTAAESHRDRLDAVSRPEIPEETVQQRKENRNEDWWNATAKKNKSQKQQPPPIPMRHRIVMKPITATKPKFVPEAPTSPPNEDKKDTNEESKITDEDELDNDSLMSSGTPKRPRASASSDEISKQTKAKKVDSESEESTGSDETLTYNIQ